MIMSRRLAAVEGTMVSLLAVAIAEKKVVVVPRQIGDAIAAAKSMTATVTSP